MQRPLCSTALALATLVPAALLTTASPAGAICHPGPFAFGTTAAAEQPRYPSTCDGDAFYAGQAYDPVTDGSCATVRYRPNNTTGAGWIQGQACTTGAFTSYNAQGGPFEVRLCKGTSTTQCSAWFEHFGF
jgi:hypothetical protein